MVYYSSISPYMKIYNSHIKNRQDPAVQYTLLLYNGLLAMEKGCFEKALEYFSHQKTLLEQGLIYSRYNLVAMTNTAKALAGMGRMSEEMSNGVDETDVNFGEGYPDQGWHNL